MSSSSHRPLVPGIERLDGICRADHLANLGAVGQERGELFQRRPRRVNGRSGIDRFHRSFHRIPILLGGELERVPNEVNDARLHRCQRPHVPDDVRQSFLPVTDQEERVGDTAVLDIGQDRHPKLGARTVGVGPQPENVLLTVQGHPDGRVDGPVGDLPITNLHHDHINKDRCVDAIQRAGLPRLHLLDHIVRDAGKGLFGDLRAVDLVEVCADLPGREAAGIG